MFVDNCILRIALWIYKLKGELKFGEWLKLEGLKEKVIKAVENSSDDFPTLLVEFISTALHIPAKYFQDAEWIYVIQAFQEILQKSPHIKIPLTEPSHETSNPDAWDYDGRTWHLYAHLLASEYGWTLEYISHLPVMNALAIIQEILVEKQLDREFQYGLSEMAYTYDTQTKKSRFVPMQRPHWMRPQVKVESIKRIKLPISSIPVGNVNYDSLPEEFRPQQIIH